jgi:hypothetical protein
MMANYLRYSNQSSSALHISFLDVNRRARKTSWCDTCGDNLSRSQTKTQLNYSSPTATVVRYAATTRKGEER